MAVSFIATGITALSDTVEPYGDLTYTLPTGTQAGDLLIALYGGKHYYTIPSTPDGYVAHAGGADGTYTTIANGQGSVYAVAFTRVHDGSESDPVSTFSSAYRPAVGAMLALRDPDTTNGDWSVTSCKGSDPDGSGTTFSVTGDATLGYATGDVVVALLVHNDDSSSDSDFGISVPGCVVGTVTQRLTGTLETSIGYDARMYAVTATITSGTATGAPVATATTGVDDSGGQVVFLRVVPPPTAGTITTTATLSAEAEIGGAVGGVTHEADATLTATVATSTTPLLDQNASASLPVTATVTSDATPWVTATALLTGTASVTPGVLMDLAAAADLAATTGLATVTMHERAITAGLSISAAMTVTAPRWEITEYEPEHGNATSYDHRPARPSATEYEYHVPHATMIGV